MTGSGAPTAKWPGWKVGGATILSFVALLYIIEIADQLTGHALDRNGIRPLETDGLKGILFAPLLHADWAHLLANTVPALVLGFLVTLAGMARFVWATAIIWILGGLGTWLIGGIGSCALGTNHIGASGLIFGWLTFLPGLQSSHFYAAFHYIHHRHTNVPGEDPELMLAEPAAD